jgi:hypothetical protein
MEERQWPLDIHVNTSHSVQGLSNVCSVSLGYNPFKLNFDVPP